MASFSLPSLKALFFDIYATLIDWESGILPMLFKLASSSKSDPSLGNDTPASRSKLLGGFHHHSVDIWRDQPTLLYPQVLEEVYARIARDCDAEYNQEDAVAFGRSIGEWPAYPDTVAAMQKLGKHYKLFVLSNVDNDSFKRTCSGPLNGVKWDGIYTAEMIGSYKPDPKNYQYVVDRAGEMGIKKDEMVLVAQSLDIDHVSTKKLEFKPGVWIARGGSAMGGKRKELEEAGAIQLGAEYETLGDMAEAVEEAFSS
jgi:2-haloalkanoic acid dehalogenase type II